jgi:hypothetical protein
MRTNVRNNFLKPLARIGETERRELLSALEKYRFHIHHYNEDI